MQKTYNKLDISQYSTLHSFQYDFHIGLLKSYISFRKKSYMNIILLTGTMRLFSKTKHLFEILN